MSFDKIIPSYLRRSFYRVLREAGKEFWKVNDFLGLSVISDQKEDIRVKNKEDRRLATTYCNVKIIFNFVEVNFVNGEFSRSHWQILVMWFEHGAFCFVIDLWCIEYSIGTDRCRCICYGFGQCFGCMRIWSLCKRFDCYA